MGHGFHLSDGMFLAPLAVVLLSRLPDFLARRKAVRAERLAAGWPTVSGRVRAGSARRAAAGGWRVTLTFSSSEPTYGNELWWHDFPSKAQAEHARQAIVGRECIVHYNPERMEETTLLWSEVQPVVEQDPYVPQLVRLGQVGYRWTIGLAVLAWSGVFASSAAYGLAMKGSVECVCDVILILMAATVVVLSGALVLLSRMLVVAPGSGVWSRLGFVLNGWQRWGIGVSLAGMVASLVYFGPQTRAFHHSTEMSDKVMAGTLGAILVPAYLFAALVTTEALKRLRPIEETAVVPVEIEA